MTFDDYLAQAYIHRMQLAGSAEDPAPACAATIDAATLHARRDALAAVEHRCVVSRVQREFIDRVLSLPPMI